MIGHAKLLTELKRVVKASPADATSACAHGSIRRVMRFAYETIHQDLLQESLDVYIKVVRDGRIGVAATDTLDRAGLRRCLKAALEIAKHSPRIKSLPPLPGRFELISTDDYVPKTMDASAKAFHDALGHLFRVCQGVDAQLAGSCTLGDDERAVVTSSGVACYAALTGSGAKLVTMHRKLSGFAGAVERDIRKLDLERLLERSLKQCLHRREPVTVPTGTYEVILEPEAVAELMNWMGYIAFNAKSLQERTSCLAGRIGEQMAAKSITLFDDGNDPAGLRMPFDYEGVPKQRVPLFERGRAAGVVYDSIYGHFYGRPSTGHGQPPNDVEGPFPSHLFLEPGTSTREAMIRRCARGILVPRFHYVSGLLDTREALMTGLTREGACLIKDGKIAGPITTMRFTQSWTEALRHVLAISRDRELIADLAQDVGSAVMPTLHLAKFRFSGQSESER